MICIDIPRLLVIAPINIYIYIYVYIYICTYIYISPYIPILTHAEPDPTSAVLSRRAVRAAPPFDVPLTLDHPLRRAVEFQAAGGVSGTIFEVKRWK